MQNKDYYLNNSSPEPAKDAFDYKVEDMINRALLSPIIKEGQLTNEEMMNFVTYHPIGSYMGNIAVVVAFIDSTQGSFFPHWFVQSSIFVGKDKPIRLKALQTRHVERLIELCNRIVESCEMATSEQNVFMQRTKFQYEWRVPLSEKEILKMDKVFQELIRRAK